MNHTISTLVCWNQMGCDRADAILAASSRRASVKAKKKNPRLLRVRGKAKK